MPWDRTAPKSRDYGGDWPKIRKQWAARHHPSDPCYRCRVPLGPMGSHLHLDHDDFDRSIVRGFSHRSCNESAAARKANANRKAKRNTPVVANRYNW